MASWAIPLSFAALLLLLAARSTSSAPVVDEEQQQTTQLAEYEGADSGCYYNFQHYAEGDRIATNEPCLNCTCHRRMLMCYLRVCPFTRAIGQDCSVEKRPDQCCPVVTCPEVPVHLVTSTSTTAQPAGSTAVARPDSYGCSIDGEFYADGAQVAGDPNKPCELCYCIRNRTACVVQQCTLQVEGCSPVFRRGVCCPVRYDCDYSDELLLSGSTERPSGLVLTTTPGPVGCNHNGDLYEDGARIAGTTACEHCYCMRGDVVCAVQDCSPPLSGCTALPTRPGACCPEAYQCANGTVNLELLSEVNGEASTQSSPSLSGEVDATLPTKQPQDYTNKASEITVVETATKGVKVEENAHYDPASEPDTSQTDADLTEDVYVTEQSPTQSPIHADAQALEEDDDDAVTNALELTEESVSTNAPQHSYQQDYEQHTTLQPEGEYHEIATVEPEQPDHDQVTIHNQEEEYQKPTPNRPEQEYHEVTTDRPQEDHEQQTDRPEREPEVATTEALENEVTEIFHQSKDWLTTTAEHLGTTEQENYLQDVPTTEKVIPPSEEYYHHQDSQQPAVDAATQDLQHDSVEVTTMEEQEEVTEAVALGDLVPATQVDVTESAPLYTQHDETESNDPEAQENIGATSSQHEGTELPSVGSQQWTESTLEPEIVTSLPQDSTEAALHDSHQVSEEPISEWDQQEHQLSTDRIQELSQQTVTESETEQPVVKEEVTTEVFSQEAEQQPASTSQPAEDVTDAPSVEHQPVVTYETESEQRPGEEPNSEAPQGETSTESMIYSTEKTDEIEPFSEIQSGVSQSSTELATEAPAKEETHAPPLPGVFSEAYTTEQPIQAGQGEQDVTNKPLSSEEDQLNEIGDGQASFDQEENGGSQDQVVQAADKEPSDEDSNLQPTSAPMEAPEHDDKPPVDESGPVKRPEENFVIEYPIEHAAQFAGSCVVDGMIFINGSGIPPANPCQTTCHCLSGMVHCVLENCAPPPPKLNRCMPVHHEGVCCPTYACDSDGGISPESDSQMADTEEPSIANIDESSEDKDVGDITSQSPVQNSIADTTESQREPESTTTYDKQPIPYGEDTPVPIPLPEKPTDVEIISDTTVPAHPVTHDPTYADGVDDTPQHTEGYDNDALEEQTAAPTEANITPPRQEEHITASIEYQPAVEAVTTEKSEPAAPEEQELASTYAPEEVATIHDEGSEEHQRPAEVEEVSTTVSVSPQENVEKDTDALPENVQEEHDVNANEQFDEVPGNESPIHETERPLDTSNEDSQTEAPPQRQTLAPERLDQSEDDAFEHYSESTEVAPPLGNKGESNVYGETPAETTASDFEITPTSEASLNQVPVTSSSLADDLPGSQPEEHRPIFDVAEENDVSTLSPEYHSERETTVHQEEPIQTSSEGNYETLEPVILEQTTSAAQQPSKITEEKVTEEKITEEKVTEEKVTEEQTTTSPAAEYPASLYDESSADISHDDASPEIAPTWSAEFVTTVPSYTTAGIDVQDTSTSFHEEIPAHPTSETSDAQTPASDTSDTSESNTSDTSESDASDTSESETSDTSTSNSSDTFGSTDSLDTSESDSASTEGTEAPESHTYAEVKASTASIAYPEDEETTAPATYKPLVAAQESVSSEEPYAPVETTAQPEVISTIQPVVDHAYVEDISPETDAPLPIYGDQTVSPTVLPDIQSVSHTEPSSPEAQVLSESQTLSSTDVNLETEMSTSHVGNYEIIDQTKSPEESITVQPEISHRPPSEEETSSQAVPGEVAPFIEQDETVNTEAAVTTHADEMPDSSATTKIPEHEPTWSVPEHPIDVTTKPSVSEPAKEEETHTTEVVHDEHVPEAAILDNVDHIIQETTPHPSHFDYPTTHASKPPEEEEKVPSIVTTPSSIGLDVEEAEESDKPSEPETPDEITDEIPESVVSFDQNSPVHAPPTPEVVPSTSSTAPSRPSIPTSPNKLPPGFLGQTEDLSQFAGIAGMAGQENFPPGSGTYLPPGEDYDEEDDQAAFGPGTCRYAGKVYVSAQQIPRDDPCDFCFCFRSDIICLQQSCPPPIPACHEEPINGFCCPRYECPVSMATALNITTTTTTTTTTLPPHFLHHAYRGAAHRTGCQVRGQAYRVGETVRSASGPCLHCSCGGDGQMQCEPKVCSPEPMLRKMIAAAAAAKRKR